MRDRFLILREDVGYEAEHGACACACVADCRVTCSSDVTSVRGEFRVDVGLSCARLE